MPIGGGGGDDDVFADDALVSKEALESNGLRVCVCVDICVGVSVGVCVARP